VFRVSTPQWYLVSGDTSSSDSGNDSRPDSSCRPTVGPRPSDTVEELAERRNRVVTLLTDAEFEKLRKIADKEGRSASALVHVAVLQFFRQQKK
jgi:hypothetical protein